MSTSASPAAENGEGVALPSQTCLARISAWNLSLIIFVMGAPLFFLRGIGVFDDSYYLTLGRMLSRGAVPYVDFIENKTPGIFYLAALLTKVADHWLLPRIFLFLFACGFAYFVTAFVNRRFGREVARLTALFFSVGYVIAQGYSFHTEQFAALFGFGAMVLLTSGEPTRIPPGRLFLCGVGLALAFLFKQSAALYMPALLAAHLFGRPPSVWLKECLFVVMSFAAVFALYCTFVWGQGYLEPMIHTIFVEGLRRASGSLRWDCFFLLIVCNPSTALSLAVLPVCLVKKPGKLPPEVLACLFMGVVSLLPALPNQNSNGHNAQFAVPFLSVVVSYFLWRLALEKRFAPYVGIVVIPWFVAMVAGSGAMIAERKLSRDLRLMNQIRNILHTRLPPSEKIYVVSSSMAGKLYYISGREAAHPYLTAWYNDTYTLGDQERYLLSTYPSAIITDTRIDDSDYSNLWSKLKSHYDTVAIDYADGKICVLLRK